MTAWREGRAGDLCLLLLPDEVETAALAARQEGLRAHFGGRPVHPVHLTCDRFELPEKSDPAALAATLRRFFAPIRPLPLTAAGLRTIPTAARGHILKWELVTYGRLPSLLDQLVQLLASYSARLFYAPQQQPGLVTALAQIEQTDVTTWHGRWPDYLFTAAQVALSRIEQPGEYSLLDQFELIGYQLRPATPADYDFLYNLHRSTIREYVDDIWGWDEARQQDRFRQLFDPTARRIIQFDGQDIGVLQLAVDEKELFLGLIEILPDYQGRGIGTAVVLDVLAQAEQAALPVRLQVLFNNPAQHLYARLGFAITDRSETHLTMRATGMRATGMLATGLQATRLPAAARRTHLP
jgi:ribosomal protein S18 acetylase RimI-like enzyme